MPESNLDEIDYIPPAWNEDIHHRSYIEWRYSEDSTILVRFEYISDSGTYLISPIAGLNKDDEEYVTKPINVENRETALSIAITLVYAMNGVIKWTEDYQKSTGRKK